MFTLKALQREGVQSYEYQERSGATTGIAGLGTSVGLVAETRVATTIGWRPVEGLVAGDMVLTFDNGFQPVRRVDRCRAWVSPLPCPRSMWPLHVPAGALGNAVEQTLMPEQVVMIEDDLAEQIFGDPFALIHASSLDGLADIHRVAPTPRMRVVMPSFDDDQVMFTDFGAMFVCPGKDRDNGLSDLLSADVPRIYDPLHPKLAQALIDAMAARKSKLGS